MKYPTLWHLGGGFLFTVIAGLVWWCKWPSSIAAIVVFLIDLYLVAILIEAARRAELGEKDAVRVFKFPSLSFSLLQILFVLMTVVTGFAAMYIESGDIIKVTTTAMLGGRIDGLYYSMVTITTLGYGDFAPKGTTGELLVIWQLFTGFLLLLGIFPLVVARLSGYKSE